MQLKTTLTSIPTIIALSGKKGSGKSTIAEALTLFGYQRWSFSSLLNLEIIHAARNLHGYPEPRLGFREGFFPSDLIDLWDFLGTVNTDEEAMRILTRKPADPIVRRLQQWYGTEYRRAEYGEDYWVDKSAEHIRTMLRNGPVVLENVRFPNEQALVTSRSKHKLGITGVRVLLEHAGHTDDNPVTDNHISDDTTRLSYDLIIKYSHTPQDLISVVSLLTNGESKKMRRMSKINIRLPKSAFTEREERE